MCWAQVRPEASVPSSQAGSEWSTCETWDPACEDVLGPGEAGGVGAIVPGGIPCLERRPLGLPGGFGPAGQRGGGRLGVPVAGEDRRVGTRGRVRLDRGSVLLGVVPAFGRAAFDSGAGAGHRRAEHVEELGRLRRGDLHAVVAGGQVGLVLRADVGQRIAGCGVVRRVLLEVVGVGLLPVTAAAGGAGHAADRAAVVGLVVVFMNAGADQASANTFVTPKRAL